MLTRVIQSRACLPAKSRPAEVTLWMKTRGYTDDEIPHIQSIDKYRESWTKWWMNCQPSWRLKKGWPLSRELVKNPTWGKLSTSGTCGLFLVVMSTTWWATSLQSADDRRFFDDAVDDIQWVIDRQLEMSPVPNVPPVDSDPPGVVESDVPAIPNYLQRGEGKRKPKPTRWLLEGMTK